MLVILILQNSREWTELEYSCVRVIYNVYITGPRILLFIIIYLLLGYLVWYTITG